MQINIGFGHQWVHLPDHEIKGYILSYLGLYTDVFQKDHLLRHHVYTNTIADHHVASTEPFIVIPPYKERPLFNSNWISNHIILTVVTLVGIPCNFVESTINSLIKRPYKLRWNWCLFFIRALFSILCVNGNIWLGLKLFMYSTLTVSTYYYHIALLNHNQNENWNLKKLNECRDWGEWQIITCSDIGYNYGNFYSMLSLWLNYHCVHHLFPTLDMSYHQDIQHFVLYMANKYNIKYSFKSFTQMYFETVDQFTFQKSWNEIKNL